MRRKTQIINNWLPVILIAGWLAMVSPAVGGEILEIGNFQVDLLNAGESATGGALTGYGNPSTITGTAEWSAEQKQAVIQSLNVLNGSFTNIAGRKVRVAIALRDDLPERVLGSSGSTLLWDQPREHVTTTAEAAWRDGTGDDYFPGTVDDIIQISTSFPWHFGPGLPDPGTYDFQSVLVHEIVHSLGIVSANFRSDYGYYFGITKWDSLMRDQQGNVAAGGTTGDPNPMTLIGPEGSIYWTGAYANATYGGNMPIFTDPEKDLRGSTLSHPAPMGELMGAYLTAMRLTRAPTKLVLDIFRDLGWSVNPDFYNAFGPTYYGDNETIEHQGHFVSNYDYAYGMYVNGDGNHIIHSGVLDAQGDFAKALHISGNSYRLDITGILQSSGDYSQALYAYGSTGLINHQGLIKADGIGSTGILLSASKGAELFHAGTTMAGDGLAAIRFDNPKPQYGYSNSLHILNGSFIQGDIINTNPMQEAIISFGYAFDPDGTLSGVTPGFSFNFADDIIGNWNGYLGAGVTTFNGNAAFQLLTVKESATLKGGGVITGAVMNQGCVAPGNSIGTLVVAGDYHQTTGATLQMEIGGSQSDLLTVVGDATFDHGALLALEPIAPILAGDFSLLSVGGSLSGTPQINLADSALLDFTLNSDSTVLALQVDRTAYAEIAGTGNQQAVGTVLDRLLGDASGGLASVLLNIDGLSRIDDVQQTLNALVPSSYSALPDAAFSTMRSFTAALPSIESLLASTTTEGAYSCHAQTLLLNAERQGDDGIAGYRINSGGVIGGADRRFGNLLLGGALSYQKTEIDHDDSRSQSRSETVLTALRAAVQHDRWQLQGLLGYGHEWDDSQREIRAIGLSRQAESDGQADIFFAGMKSGYTFGSDALALIPFVGLDYAAYRWGGFDESEADGLNVDVENTTAESLRSSLGVVLAAPLSFGTLVTLDTQLRLNWSHEFADDSYGYQARLAGERFSVHGQDLGRDLLSAGLRLQAHLGENIIAKLGLDYERRNQDDGFAAQVGILYPF